MLNDISSGSSCNFNFHLSSSLSQNKLKSLLNSATNSNDSQPLTESVDKKCLDSKDLLKTVSSHGPDNLSWKFFEHVDTVDHQLRNDKSSPPHLPNGNLLKTSSSVTSPTVIATTAAADTHDVNAIAANTMSALGGLQQQQHGNINYHHTALTTQTLPIGTGTSNRKSNGYAINGTLLQSTEILSQTNATTTTAATIANSATATNLNNTKAIQSLEATFVFTSPTSTFKRKKQQQLQREEEKAEAAEQLQYRQQKQQQQQHFVEELQHNNLHQNGAILHATERPIGSNDSAITLNDDYSNTSSSKGSNTTLLRQQLQQQQQQQSYHNQQQQQHHNHQQQSNNINATKTVINTTAGGNGTSYIGNVNGTTTNYTTRAHTLPGINKTTSSTTSKLQHQQEHQQQPSSAATTYIADVCVVDLVHDTKCATGKSLTRTNKTKSSKHRKDNNTTTTTCNNKSGRGNSNNTKPSSATKAKMQASSSGGSGTSTTAKGFSNSSSLVDDIEMHLGLIGWRKKCLYTLLVLLMLLIIVNLGLTLWILKVMEFSTEGMGQLKIVPGGIQLTGQALIMDMLRASTIRSRHGQPIAIESSRNFSINTRGLDGLVENHLFLGHDKLECLATSFRINDTNGRNLFSVNRDEVTIGAHALRIDGEGGAIFRESIQTPHIRAEPGRELRLESPTRDLEMTAAKDINLVSRAGGIEISALEDIKLKASDGSIRLESSKIFMPNLRTVQLPLPGTPQSREHLHRVFQLCACYNGKLFLAAPHSVCAGDDSTVCR